jgi:hypothetical protein
MVEKSANDKAQWAAVINKVRAVSGLGGRNFAHWTRKSRNLKTAAAKKIIRKLTLKRIANLAKFFTIKIIL